MSVRVIAGSAKRRRLQVPDTPATRPTGDRARESLFNVLAPRLTGAAFLDAFAGSGAVGIEALSRGAEVAVFVEHDRRAVRVLVANLESCSFRERAHVLAEPWVAAARRLGGEGRRFDVAFFDPPYDGDDAPGCLRELRAHELLAARGVAVIEHARDTPPAAAAGWALQRRLAVGDTSFSFFDIIAGHSLPEDTHHGP